MPKLAAAPKLALHRLAAKRWGATGLERIMPDLPAGMTVAEFETQLAVHIARHRPKAPCEAERLFARARRMPAEEREYLLQLLIGDLYEDDMALVRLDDAIRMHDREHK